MNLFCLALATGAMATAAAAQTGTGRVGAQADAAAHAGGEVNVDLGAEAETAEARRAPGPSPPDVAAPHAPAPSSGPRRVHATVGANKQAEPEPQGIRGTSVSTTALVASGVSVAQGAEHPIANRSPVMLAMDLGFTHPEVSWFEIGPGMMLEMERGVAFGLALRARAFLPLRRIRPYALAAIPALLVPTTLFGAQFGAGVSVKLHRYFSLAAEIAPTVFFWGADLPNGGTVTKFDGAAGLRVTF